MPNNTPTITCAHSTCYKQEACLAAGECLSQAILLDVPKYPGQERCQHGWYNCVTCGLLKDIDKSKQPYRSEQIPSNPKQIFGDLKVPLALVPSSALIAEAEAMADGARKYGPYNWRENSVEAMTYIHAALRHIYSWLDGEELDPESGKPHLGHARACLGILVDAQATGNMIDNRPKKGHTGDLLREKAQKKELQS